MFVYNLWVFKLYMSSYGMCPYVFFVHFIVHTFGCGYAVINIDIISYLVVKNVILNFRPCYVYPVG